MSQTSPPVQSQYLQEPPPAKPENTGYTNFLFPNPVLMRHAHLLALGSCTALAATAVSLLGWYSQELLLLAAILGSALFPLALLHLSRHLAARRSMRLALQNVEARIGGLVASSIDPIITVDDKQRIVLYNTAAENVFLWPRGTVLGLDLEMLIPERFRAVHRQHMERFAQTGVTSRRMDNQTIMKGMRANGEEFPIEASISRHSENDKKLYTVILRDVTERVRAEETSARSAAHLRNILESAMDAIITVDDSQHIVLFNTAAETMFACPREQAIGEAFANFIPDRLRAAYIQNFNDAASDSPGVDAMRIITGLRRNGEEFPIDASISQIDEQGKKFYTVILRDITQNIRAEEALHRSKEELHELASAAHFVREQEKSRIARELHDELGQALTAMQMDITWLKENLPQPHQEISKKLAAMETLLDSTAAATRRIASDLRPLMLDDLGLIAATEWLVQSFTERTGVPCALRIGNPQPELQDPYATAVFRILQESLNNIAKHAKASRVEVALAQDDSSISIHVRDNGIGFALDKPRQPGSYGLLGLRERACLLNGNIVIDSAPDKGTSVTVSLPLI